MAVLYTDTGIVDASYMLHTSCDACDVIYYVIAVCARRMVRIFFLPYLSNRSKSDPCSYELFCLESQILSFPKVLQIPPESPCINKNNVEWFIPQSVNVLHVSNRQCCTVQAKTLYIVQIWHYYTNILCKFSKQSLRKCAQILCLNNNNMTFLLLFSS